MRKVIFLAAIIFSAIIAAAQQPVQITQPYHFHKWVIVDDSVRGAIFLQAGDTLATKAYARGFAGSTPGFGLKLSGGQLVWDSANVRKTDTLYAVNDSTVAYKINGHLYTFLIRGRYSPGTPCTGCLLASNNFSDIGNTGTARVNLGLGALATLTPPFMPYNYLNGYGNFQSFSTDSVLEGSANKYYHDASARAAISVLSPLLYNNSTGVLSADTTPGGTHLATQNYVAGHGGGGGMTNPMTSGGDLIYGASDGSPLRLPAATNHGILHSSATPGWGPVDVSAEIIGIMDTSHFPTVPYAGTYGSGGLIPVFTAARSGITGIGSVTNTPAWVNIIGKPTFGTLSALSYPSITDKYLNGYGNFSSMNTDSITEGSTNLFYTNARSRAAISVTAPLVYNSSTGVISDTASSGSGTTTPQSLTDASTVTWDVSISPIATLVIGGNRALSLISVPNGQTGVLLLIQDATGGRTLSLPGTLAGGIRYPPGDTTVIGFIKTGSVLRFSSDFIDSTISYPPEDITFLVDQAGKPGAGDSTFLIAHSTGWEARLFLGKVKQSLINNGDGMYYEKPITSDTLKLHGFSLVDSQLVQIEFYKPGLILQATKISGGGGYDPDAAAYFAAVGTVSTPDKNSIDSFVVHLKSAGLWTKMTAFWPIYGTTLSTAKYNLINPTTHLLTQTGSGTFSNGFINVSSTGAGLYTDITPVGSTSTYSMGVSTRTGEDVGGVSFGLYSATIASYIAPNLTLSAYYISSLSNSFNTGSTSTSLGRYIVSSSSTTFNVYRNASALGSTVTRTPTTTSEFYVIGNGTSNGGNNPYLHTISTASFWNTTLSSGDVTTYDALLNTLETALGR